MHVFLVAFKYEGDPVTKLIKWDNGPMPLKPFSDQEIRNLVVYFSLMLPKENSSRNLPQCTRRRCTWSTLIFK